MAVFQPHGFAIAVELNRRKFVSRRIQIELANLSCICVPYNLPWALRCTFVEPTTFAVVPTPFSLSPRLAPAPAATLTPNPSDARTSGPYCPRQLILNSVPTQARLLASITGPANKHGCLKYLFAPAKSAERPLPLPLAPLPSNLPLANIPEPFPVLQLLDQDQSSPPLPFESPFQPQDDEESPFQPVEASGFQPLKELEESPFHPLVLEESPFHPLVAAPFQLPVEAPFHEEEPL